MPYEEHFNRMREYNHQLVVAKRITAKRVKRERLENTIEVMSFVFVGIMYSWVLYFLVALGGTYR